MIGDADGDGSVRFGRDPFVAFGYTSDWREHSTFSFSLSGAFSVFVQATALPLRANTGLDDLCLEALVADFDINDIADNDAHQGRRASAIDCCSVGEKVPLVISP